MRIRYSRRLGAILAGGVWLHAGLSVAAAAKNDAAAEPKGVAVTVTMPKRIDLEIWQPAVGYLEARSAPRIAAEVAGRVIAVQADVGDKVKKGVTLATLDSEDARLSKQAAEADVSRIDALIRAQRLTVKRLRALVKERSAKQSALDDAVAQLAARRAERMSAMVRVQEAERRLAKTAIRSPIDGRVDARQVSVGDYVAPGTLLFRLIDPARLRARLPYPESLIGRLRPGEAVRLESPSAPGREVNAVVSEVRPSVTAGSRAVQVIVNVTNPGGWRPDASVSGRVRVARHKGALLVPETSVVPRPAGMVVYVVEGSVARQRVVRKGITRDGETEIREGLKGDERVVVDGAGFLTEGATVEVKRP